MKIFEIIEIELENIKTYVSEKITFSNGNNVLIGENGAGKSTILECIYLALFGDTVPGRNLADMIRLGQKQGKITFRFSVDSVNYRIEDVIVIKGDNRTTQNQVLINQDQGDTIAEGRNAVRVKIEELLDVDATTFISAIYASQGEIGKIITDKDSDRKKLFDRLFQIERYEKTWSNLSKVEKVINRNITDLENNISILKDDLIDLPEHQKQLSIKKTQLKQEKMDYSLLKNQFKEIDQKFKALEKLIEKHNKLLAKKNHINEQQKFLTDSISNQTNIIEEKIENHEIEYTLKSFNKLKKNCELKIEKISEMINKLRDEEQSIKLNLEKIINFEQNELLLDSTINQNIDEIETEIKYFTSKITGISKNISNWSEKIPDLIKNSEIKIEKLKTEEKKINNTSNKIIQLKAELETKMNVVNKNHNRIFQKRFLLAQEAGENWREVIENLSHSDFKKELEKITIKINEFDKKNTELLKQKSILENNIKRIQGDLQHLTDLKEEKTCPTCKQKLSKVMLEELSSTLVSEKKKNQDEVKDLIKEIQNLEKEIKKAKEQEKALMRRNQLYSTLKPNFDELISLENENNELEEEYKVLEESYNKVNEDYDQNQLQSLKEQISSEEEKIKDILTAKRLLPKLLKITEKITKDKKQLAQIKKEISMLKEKFSEKNLENIKDEIINQENEIKKYSQLKDDFNQIIRDFQTKEINQNQLISIQHELTDIESIKGFNEFTQIENKRIELGNKISSKETIIKSLNEDIIPPLIEQINKLEKKENQLKEKEIERKQEIKKKEITSILRGLMRELPNRLLPNFIERINNTATEILQSIIPGSDIQNIVLNDDYSLNIIRSGNFENITVLSGGETIIIALALRLAFAKEFSALDLLILDEPTIFLDERRRGELVSVLEKNRLVRQMFVVTHDPDFERISDKTYFITKLDGETSVRTMEDEVIDSSISDLTL